MTQIYLSLTPQTLSSSYDEIAGMYHALWQDHYLPAALPALEKLFFTQVPAGSRILDLCCGSGHVTQEFVRRGYSVTGVDSSTALITLARKDMPGVDLRVQDARELKLEGRYDAAISTFDSLNHILSLEELHAVFTGVLGSLARDALFVFDMNLEQAYTHDARQWTVDVGEKSTSLVRGTYNAATKMATTELIWFVRTLRNSLWRRRRSIVEQRCYTQKEIVTTLSGAGFTNIKIVPAMEAGVGAGLGFGRIFVIARP